MSVATAPSHAAVARPERVATRRGVIEVVGRLSVVLWLFERGPKIFYSDLGDWVRRSQHLGLHQLPYRDVRWEFPPLTVPLLYVVHALAARPTVLVAVFGAVTIACEYGSLCMLRRTWPERTAELTGWWTVVVLPVALIAWFRFDFLAVACATAALVAIETGRRGAARWSVAGAFAKLWPIVWLPVLLARRAWREVAAAVAALLVGLAAWWAFSPSGVRAFVGVRAGSGLEVESVGGSVLQITHRGRPSLVSGAWVVGAGGWGWVNAAGIVAVLVLVVALTWRAVRLGQRSDAVAVAGALTVALLLASRLLSAQYLVWLGPFVVVLAAIRSERRVGALAAAVSLLTLASLIGWEGVRTGHGLGPWIVLLRNAALIALAAELIRVAWRPRPA